MNCSRLACAFLAILMIASNPVFATEAITNPGADPIETWHYGTGENSQTVTFSYDMGCSAYTITIAKYNSPGDELYSKAFGAPSSNPVNTNILVPDPLSSSTRCVLSVEIRHTMGNTTNISQNLKINKP